MTAPAHPGLAGSVVVVTGAAAGQGAAEARLLASCGARVFAVDLAEQPPSTLSSSGGVADGEIVYRRLDVTDESAWRALGAEIAQEVSPEAPLKGLINNAGITHRARLGAVERSDWDRVLAVNVTGPLLGIQALAPLMGSGSAIVNVGSIAALTGHYPVAYTTSKWALRGLTHVVATELGPRGIRVNLIHPGFIETDMTAGAPAAMRAAQLELTPLEVTGSADQVAQAAVFLLSDAAAYIAGAELPVDGGFTSSGGAKLIADRLAAGA